MKEPKISSLIKLSVLLLLKGSGKYGYEIIKTIGKDIGKKISAGEIYPFLKTLRQHGLVTAKDSGSREKKIYSLTKKGKSFTRDVLKRFDLIIDSAVKDRIHSCTNCGCKVYIKGFYRKIRGVRKIFCCESCSKIVNKVR